MFSSLFFNGLDSKYHGSVIAQVVGSAGDTMESAITSEVEKQVNSYIDISSLSYEGCRSYLAFIRRAIRNYSSAYGDVDIEILSATGLVTIPKYTTLVSSNGVFYCNDEEIVASQGDTVTFKAIQGIRKSTSGTYDTYVALQQIGIDLDYTEIYLNGGLIPIGTENFDSAAQYYFQDTLFVKIFRGITIQAVQDQNYQIVYLQSDGLLGNIEANTLSKFNQVIRDANGKEVTYALSHDAIVNGLSDPELYELRDAIRYWTYSKETLSRISDYLYFFRNRSEVGDAKVWGDWEEWLRTGTIDITGKVRVYLVSPSITLLSQSEIDSINEALSEVKDMSFIEYKDFKTIYHYFKVYYSQVKEETAWRSYITNLITDFYTLSFIRNRNESIFDDLDINDILQEIDYETYTPIYLEIVPYVYTSLNILSGQVGFTMSLQASDNLAPGDTYYEYDGETWTEEFDAGDSYNIINESSVVKGTHDYVTNEITWTISFPVDGTLEMKSLVDPRSIVPEDDLETLRKLKGIEVIKR